MQLMRCACIDRSSDKDRFSWNGNAHTFECDHPSDQPNAVSRDQGGEVGHLSQDIELSRISQEAAD